MRSYATRMQTCANAYVCIRGTYVDVCMQARHPCAVQAPVAAGACGDELILKPHVALMSQHALDVRSNASPWQPSTFGPLRQHMSTYVLHTYPHAAYVPSTYAARM